MIAKLIKTEAEHAAAIDRLSKLMDQDPAPGTKAADELELLAHLIEDYEKKKHRIELPDPLSAIQFRMEQQGLRRKDLVQYFGSQSRVSEVLSGKRALTLEMIRKLHEGLGIPTEVLVQPLQQTQKKPDPVAPPRTEALKRMCALGWFGKVISWSEAKGQISEMLQTFFDPGVSLAPALNRQIAPKNAKFDHAALLAWQHRILQVAAKRRLESGFEPQAFPEQFLYQLKGLSRTENGPLAALGLLEDKGVITVIQEHLPGTFLDGAALLLKKHRPVIALTLRRDRIDHFWFCLFHELGHVLKHLATGKANGFIDDSEATTPDECEREADDFARDTLIPRPDWERFCNAGLFDHVSVCREAKRLNINAAILAGRVREHQNDYRWLTSLVGNGKIRKLFKPPGFVKGSV